MADTVGASAAPASAATAHTTSTAPPPPPPPSSFRLKLVPSECLDGNHQNLPPCVELANLPVAIGRACARKYGTANYALKVNVTGMGISRQHSSFLQGPQNTLQVVDESSQGVAVNGVRIQPLVPTTLRAGDVVVLGLPQAQHVAVGAAFAVSGSSTKGGAVFRVEHAASAPASSTASACTPAAPIAPARVAAPVAMASSSTGSGGGSSSNSSSSQVEETAALDLGVEGQHDGGEEKKEGEEEKKERAEEVEDTGHQTDSSSDVEIVEVRPAVARQKKKRKQQATEIVSLLDDDDDDDDDVRAIGGGGGGGGAGARKRPKDAAAAAAAKAGAGAEEKEYKRRWLKALECTVCMEPLCTAAHISCGHIACFTCIHRRFAQQSHEDGSAYGFQERKRLCPTCRKDIFFMSRDVKMDELVEESMGNDADMMTPAERLVWEARKQDGLALSRFYEAKLCNNPQQLVHQRKEVMVKVVVRAAKPAAGGGGGGMSVVCQECRQAVEGAVYEATWSIPAAQGFRPEPTKATVHLRCLRVSACKATRKGLSPEGVMTLGFKIDVQSLFANEAGGLEGFKKGQVYQALSEERQEYPWWVDGAIKLHIPTNKKMQLVAVSGAPPVGRGAGGFVSSAASALCSRVAAVASAASSVLRSSPTAAAAASNTAAASRQPRRSPRQQPPPQQQQQQQTQHAGQQQPQPLVLDVEDE